MQRENSWSLKYILMQFWSVDIPDALFGTKRHVNRAVILERATFHFDLIDLIRNEPKPAKVFSKMSKQYAAFCT